MSTSTITTTAPASTTLRAASPSAPTKLPFSIDQLPKLDQKQAGHLRHFHNLVNQPDGEWHHMGPLDGTGEWEDAYRYQLATMCYAASVCHYHRLPALKSVFRTLMRQMIHKMLHKSVWGYWFLSSHGGNKLDPSLTELRKPWADPVKEENIMYSGHLLLMTSLYGMLFDDDEFEKEDSIVFTWDPVFWGMGTEVFRYSNRSLQKVILDQMEKNDWVGVCCEPNMVFVVCNQFPILAMRHNDARDGTKEVQKVLEKYTAALERKKMLQPDGLWSAAFMLKQKVAAPSKQGNHTAWNNSFMHAWNSDFVRKNWERQAAGHLIKLNGKTTLQATGVAAVYRQLAEAEGDRGVQDPQATLQTAVDMVRAGQVQSPWPFQGAARGLFMMMLSELGQQNELDDLLEFADLNLSPTWENGGLFYPRKDDLLNEAGEYVHVDPHSGNSCIGYARLNVENGQKIMWEKPWTKAQLEVRPHVLQCGLGDGVDFLRGAWDEEHQAMILTVKAWETDFRKPKEVTLSVEGLHAGEWGLYVNGELQRTQEIGSGGIVDTSVAVSSAEEVDIVVWKGSWRSEVPGSKNEQMV